MSVRVADLKDQTGATFPRPLLHCAHCGGEYSANKGDYFAASPSTVIECCGEPTELVTKRVTFEAAV